MDPGLLERVSFYMSYIFTDIIDAKFMDLSKIPVTTHAINFCEGILHELIENEQRARARRKNDLDSYALALKSVLSSLMTAKTETAGGWVYRSVSKKSFSNSLIKGDTFNRLIRELDKQGYLDIVKGSNHKAPFGTGYVPGLATRFRASDALMKRWKQSGFSIKDLRHHFKQQPSLAEVRLKAMSQRQRHLKINGKSLRVPRNEQVIAAKEQLERINRYLIKQSFDGTNFLGLRRIFNEGDHHDFNWNMGGRLYAIGDYNYQSLKKAARLRLKINSAPVIELDINASYLRILHGLRGFKLPEGSDVYHVPTLHRSIVKAWIKSTLGNTGFHTRWPHRTLAELKKDGLTVTKKQTYPAVQSLVLENYPVLRDWPTCGIRWSRLMFEESEAMLEVMERLQHRDIPSLPVHDSLIVPEAAGKRAHDEMTEVFERRFQVPFIISGL